jgi:hypothetical protein
MLPSFQFDVFNNNRKFIIKISKKWNLQKYGFVFDEK